MRRLASILLFAAALSIAASPVRAASSKDDLAAPDSMDQGGESRGPDFLAGTEDVPLPPGLESDESTLVVFDKPQGRIVEVEARGKLTRAAIDSFYSESLPPLGWTADGPHQWRREGERLRLAIKGNDGNLRVGFSLSPR